MLHVACCMTCIAFVLKPNCKCEDIRSGGKSRERKWESCLGMGEEEGDVWRK